MKPLTLKSGGLILVWLACFVGDIVAAPVGTAFTYQGRLKSAGQPASGSYDLRFVLYDAASGSGPVGSPVTMAPVIVTNGSFTVLLDFGAAFNGEARWLEIGVRTNGSSDPYGAVSARQPLTPTPYALYTPSAGSAATATTAGTANSLTGTFGGDVTGTQTSTVVARVGGQAAVDVASGSVTANAATNANMPDRIVKRDALGNFSAGAITAGSFTGNGGGLTGLNANNLATGTVADGRLSANVALLNDNQTFIGSNVFAGVSTMTNATNRFVGTFNGNGASLTNLNADRLASGTVASARLAGTYSGVVTFNNAGNSLSGNGAGLTSLNADSLASGTVPSARLSGTYSNALNFNNASNSFSGDGSGLTSTSLARTTVLNVPCSPTAGVPYTTTYTKLGDIGTFNKQMASSSIEVTFNGRAYATFSFGIPGAIFELRVDTAATSNGRARAFYGQSGVAVQTSITGIFTGLPAGNHTVSMWIQGQGAGGNGTAWLDQGCWATDQVVVKELK